MTFSEDLQLQPLNSAGHDIQNIARRLLRRWKPEVKAAKIETTNIYIASVPGIESGNTFLALDDVDETTYTAMGGQVVQVNSTPDGLEFIKLYGTGSVAPTVNEDSGDGYAVGSYYYDSVGLDLYLCSDATVGAAVWTQMNGGSTSPAGSDTEVQWNNSGSFGADADFSYDNTTDPTLRIGTPYTYVLNGVTFIPGFLHNRDAYALIAAISHTNTAGTAGNIYGVRSRGTTASPTIVQADDTIATFSGAGYDGTDYENAAQIIIESDGTPGNNDMPGRIVFSTTPDGSTSATEAMRLDKDQNAHFASDVDVIGKITVDAQPMCFVYLGSAMLNLTDNTWTKIQFDTETYDVGGYFDSTTNYRYTPLVDGKYLFGATVMFNQVVSGKEYQFRFYVNGSTTYNRTGNHSNSTGNFSVAPAPLILEMNGSTDYIECWAKANAGVSTVDIVGTQQATAFYAYLLG